MKYSILFIYFKLATRCEKKKKKTSGSGRVRALNLTLPLGSGRVRRSRVRAGFGLQFKARADLYPLEDHWGPLVGRDPPGWEPLLYSIRSCGHWRLQTAKEWERMSSYWKLLSPDRTVREDEHMAVDNRTMRQGESVSMHSDGLQTVRVRQDEGMAVDSSQVSITDLRKTFAIFYVDKKPIANCVSINQCYATKT